ncbi:MAG: hypothetical protein V5A88_05980 [Candidatus Thermoplasmatota archaeon]
MYGGIDLAAKVENGTGVSTLSSHGIKSATVFAEKAIIKKMGECSVIAIDAPLSRTEKPFREAERELMSEFGSILPLNTPGMKSLSKRAVRLRKKLERKTSAVVIETYPRAVEKVLSVNRKMLDADFKNEHEYDAYLCAVAAKKYDENMYEEFGKAKETIILPLSEE